MKEGKKKEAIFEDVRLEPFFKREIIKKKRKKKVALESKISTNRDCAPVPKINEEYSSFCSTCLVTNTSRFQTTCTTPKA